MAPRAGLPYGSDFKALADQTSLSGVPVPISFFGECQTYARVRPDCGCDGGANVGQCSGERNRKDRLGMKEAAN